MDNNKVIITTTQSLRYLTTFFLSFAHQQLGKIRAVLNRLVFLFGFSNDSQKTNTFIIIPPLKKDLTSISGSGIMSLNLL